MLNELQDFDESIRLANKGEILFPDSPHIQWMLAESLIRAKFFAEAYSQYKSLVTKFPKNPMGIHYGILEFIKNNFFDYAAELAQLALQSRPEDEGLLNLLVKCRLTGKGAMVSNLYAALQVMEERIACFRNKREIYSIFLDVLYDIAKFSPHFNYLHSLYLYNTNPSAQKTISKQNKPESGLAFCINPVSHLPYFSNIIRYFSPGEVTVIVEKKTELDDTVFLRCGLDGYPILYGLESCKKYEYIVTEQTIKYNPEAWQKLIFLTHSQIIFINKQNLNRCAAVIYETEKLAVRNNIKIFANELKNIPSEMKCEVAHSGIFHVDDGENHDRMSERRLIEQEYGIEIDNSRPFVFVLENNNVHQGQLVRAVNKLSEFCTVAFKPAFWVDYFSKIQGIDKKGHLDKLNDKVIVVRDKFHASNKFRFASDFIIAGLTSGSFFTSVLLGQNVIPVYSRILQLKLGNGNPTSYKIHIEDCPNKRFLEYFSTPHQILNRQFYDAGYLFDIINIAAIKDAIIGKEYINWYHKNLPALQKNSFGKYIIDGAAEKTANMICKFMKHSSFGDECDTIFLKDVFFR